MSRSKTADGTFGAVRVEAVRWDERGKPTLYAASLSLRVAGVRRPQRIQRSAGTETKAKAAVKAAAANFSPVLTSNEASMNSNSPISLLAERWFDRKTLDGKVGGSTLAVYRDQLNRHIIHELGNRKIADLTLEVVDGFLIKLTRASRTQAVQSRACLSGMVEYAASYKLIPINFMRSAFSVAKPKAVSDEDVLTNEQVLDILRFVEEYRTGKGVRGPRPDRRLLNLLRVQFGAALRIGETLALRKRDVLIPRRPSDQMRLTVHGTTIEDRSTGRVYRQPWTKSSNGFRQIPVSLLAAEALSELLDAVEDADEDTLLFQNKWGGITRPNTMHKRWQDAKRAMEKDGILEERRIVPHTFRKTMATTLARGMGPQYTALYIGHGTSTQTLFRHYVPREIVVPNVTAESIDGFGPLPFRQIPVPEESTARER